ncbi:MAG: hypothetical protein IT381_08550 [Deltaproteobacteria bacterium]|nr:hypothetical protein [Deltaproteobacteria bacterium]
MADGDGSERAPPIGPWFALSFVSLVLAGAFALFLVFARMPVLAGLVTDPAFFKRCLVVHVDLALVVWFYAFVAGLFARMPGAAQGGTGRLGAALAWVGVAALLSCLALPSATPILTNYVPSLDHPVFVAGMSAFFTGVALQLTDGRLLPARETGASSIVTAAARPGLRAAAIAFLLALLTFAGAFVSADASLAPDVRYELVLWGGGHVLQVASVAAMISVWLILVEGAIGRPVMPRALSSALFFLLVLPVMAAPALALAGPEQSSVHGAYTRMMQLGIFPVTLVFIVLCVRALVRSGAWLGDGRVLGFFASAGLTVLGFVIGALIRGPNTMVPAHYHASIGAVTAAFMTMSYLVLAGRPVGDRLARLRRIQPLIYGAGQTVFAVGFGFAGMTRKTYGAEQHIRTTSEIIGLVTMGAGGLVAVGAGLIFLAYVVRAAWPARAQTTLTTWRHSWKNANTRSNA